MSDIEFDPDDFDGMDFLAGDVVSVDVSGGIWYAHARARRAREDEEEYLAL